MASGELSLTSNSSQEGSHEFNCYPNDPRPRKTSVDSIKNFDTIKKQYDEALMELNSLRLRESDGEMQMSHLTKQLEFYKEKYMDAINQVGQTAIEGTSLRTKYADISNENRRLQQRIHQLEKMQQQQENGGGGGSHLKQQLTKAFTQLESALHEKNMLREARDKLIQENDMQIKEMQQLMNQRADDLRRVTAQRNAIKLELQTLVSEKDVVLEENQKMSDELAAAKEQLEKQYKNDQSILYENESLKRIRDELLAERNMLRERLDEKELMKSHDSNWNSDVTNDAKEKLQHELSVANKENEKLRNSLERAKGELSKALEETEVAKSRRDWAISEREKIVLERDNVKVLNDELQKERDTAVSDLLQAIRDSEDIKRQKDEALQEIDHLRKQFESQVNCSRRSIRWSHAPFETDTEVIDIDLSTIGSNDDIGIVLEGGREDSQNRIDGNNITVVSVANHSPAYGKLRPNDIVMVVNQMDCSSLSKRMVLESIRNGPEQCVIVVKRQRVTRAHMYAVHLNLLNSNRDHGLTLESGIFISKISTNSLASAEPDLTAGDRILAINNQSMESILSGKDAMAYLNDERVDSLHIIALKQVSHAVDTDTFNRNKPHQTENTCTQTDERFSFDGESTRTNSSGNSKSTSKISEMFNKFRGKIQMHGHQKGSTASESDSLCQENDAIAALDSVLNNENTTTSGKFKENIFKRSKKAKKETTKEVNKNLGTWPRANILNAAVTGQENHTGTIVQHRKKERPALSLFTGPGQISMGKDDKSMGMKKDNYFGGAGAHMMHEPTPMGMKKPGLSLAAGSNRNSNPIPFHYPAAGLNRHSVYSAMETEPVMLESGKIPSKNLPPELAANMKPNFMHYRHNNNNRLSLNITPMSDAARMYKDVDNRHRNMYHKQATSTLDAKVPNHPMSMDYVAMKNSTDSLLNSKSPMSSLDFKPNLMHQQPQDLISLKSQNSIDSFLAPTPKSPPSLESSKPMYPSDNQDFYNKRSSKNVSKFPSDSDSLGMESISSPNNSYTSTLPSYVVNSRAQNMLSSNGRIQRMFNPFANQIHSHHHMRQSSPLTIPMTQSLDIAGNNNSTDKLEYEFVQPHHAHGVSMDIDPYQHQRSSNKVHPMRDRDIIYGSYGHTYEGGTFPRKKENQRVRIPSNPSVASRSSDMKDSTGSIEHSEHSSPMPEPYKVEVLSHGANNSMSDRNPGPGYLRRITIDNKSAGSLGITIQCNEGGGIFVSSVTSNSIASRAGLRCGDQLLEVCGINMRDANYKIAAKILHQCGNTISMLAQYCPDKFQGNIAQHITEEDSVSRSGSPTPRNSPRGLARSRPVSMQQSVPQAIPKRSLISSNLKKKFSDSLENQSDCAGSPDCMYDEEEPRVLTLNTKKSTNLGISLMGGNAVGIYVHDVQKNSLADLAGLKKGDQILEYNGVDLRRVTAEYAATEISKPCDKVTVLVQHNMTKFNQIKDEAGDSLYFRAGFDRTGELNDGELRFVKDDILYVDTTIFRGKFGQWRAWKLDDYGHRLRCGIIPSQLKIEEELRMLTDAADGEGTTKRKSARRSFFRRKSTPKHQRSSSRDSKDLSTFSSTQLSWFTDSGIVGEDGTLSSYQRVERLDYMCRPVLILGPLADCVAEKLTIDFPQLFDRLLPTTMNCTQENMEEGLQNNILVDYRRRGSIYECTPVQAIRDLCDKNRHCLLDVSIAAIERLKRIQIYPIVLLLRFKSARQIKEIKDKMSEKAAKEMYEHALKLESDYRQYISAVIPAGVNITHMSTQIKAAVDEEQNKALWVPVTSS